MAKERGILSGSTVAGSKLYFCDWEGGRKGQEWGKNCNRRLHGFQSGLARETKVKFGLSNIKLLLSPSKCVLVNNYYYYHEDYVDLSMKLVTYLKQYNHEE